MVHRIEHAVIDSLFDSLRRRGYALRGPTIRGAAIVYEEITSTADLPVGWTDEQGPATYRLRHRNDKAMFGFSASPYSWKKFLFPPVLKILAAHRNGKELQISDETHPDDSGNADGKKYAFIGVRSCELNAIAIQDKVFTAGQYKDSHYRQTREGIFIVAVNCTTSGGTCFCASMGTGPRATAGYDLALTEVLDENEHYFLVDVGTERGAEALNDIEHKPARQYEIERAEQIISNASQSMGRTLDTTDIKETLYQNTDHPRWDTTAVRCLTCANCTMVCPTCFCSTIEDVTDLTGTQAERIRKWDSCFTMDFSYIHGGNVRTSPKARYRHWITHKLGSWFDQFGTSGCVGCGRCITWCPVGIDITEEIRALRGNQTHDEETTTIKEEHNGNA
ncbi:MAG: 4Fe-4S dicluster domain-containing protein [Ignavibacteriales bacterium]|nr:4Fe-4S dicluster domain-containing protein [Ignavibacteriales bacterium]